MIRDILTDRDGQIQGIQNVGSKSWDSLAKCRPGSGEMDLEMARRIGVE